jgi:hypothetical protein
LGSNFDEQLCTAVLKSSFEWGIALGNSFKTQLRGAVFGSNIGEQFSGTTLENSFETTILEVFWTKISGNNFGKSL